MTQTSSLSALAPPGWPLPPPQMQYPPSMWPGQMPANPYANQPRQRQQLQQSYPQSRATSLAPPSPWPDIPGPRNSLPEAFQRSGRGF